MKETTKSGWQLALSQLEGAGSSLLAAASLEQSAGRVPAGGCAQGRAPLHQGEALGAPLPLPRAGWRRPASAGSSAQLARCGQRGGSGRSAASAAGWRGCPASAGSSAQRARRAEPALAAASEARGAGAREQAAEERQSKRAGKGEPARGGLATESF